MAMPTALFFERYCQRVMRDTPGEWRPWEMDILGVLKNRVAKNLSMRGGGQGQAAWQQEARFNIPGSPPSSRQVSAQGLRSFHLGVNKPAQRAAKSFDRYAASKIAIAVAIDADQPGVEQEQSAPAIYDAYAVGHGGEPEAVPDHYTNLSPDSDRRASQWDAIEGHERSLRINHKPGPPRVAIFYERAPDLFDHAASLPACPDGLRKVIEKEQRRVAVGKKLSKLKQRLGQEWIDDTAPLAQAWLERLPGWVADTDDDLRLSRTSEGRGVLTHVSGEIEYPVALIGDPDARRNIRMGLAAWFDGQRNAGDDPGDGSILPVAIFDHLPDRLNDRRNLHCHFLAGTRRVMVGEGGGLTFAEHKVDAISRQGFHERLRGVFADLANVELARLEADQRLHPGKLREMGIDGVTPNKKLYGRAVVLERAGVATAHGIENDIENWRRLFDRARRRHEARSEAIDKADASDAAKAMQRRASMLRHEAEEIGLLIGMSVSRVKRTARYAPAYADAAKRDRDRAGWEGRGLEARAYLAMLDHELASERAGVKERRREAARLERAARDMMTVERQRSRDAAEARRAAHRAVDDIANTPILVTERDGHYLVERRDDPDGLVLGIDLNVADVQKRLAAQHAAQRKALAQVRSFLHKHGHVALFDEDAIGSSPWLRTTIERWRDAPIIEREERERQERADGYRATLVARNRRWAGRHDDDIGDQIADGRIVLLPTELGAPIVDNAVARPLQPAVEPAPAPLTAIQVENDEWLWRPKLPQVIPADVATGWRAAGMDVFGTDIAGFEHILAAPPSRRYVTDGPLADALGQDAARLTEPAVHARLAAIWRYQEITRLDLLATRAVPHFIPDPEPPRDPAIGLTVGQILADRARHNCDGQLQAMFEEIENGTRVASNLPITRNRLFRTALAAIRSNDDPSICRLLADAALAQDGSLAVRRSQLSDAEDDSIWAASSMPIKGIARQHPGARRGRRGRAWPSSHGR
jgi:hypothetical protein